ncbi:MAG: DUF192 domain-containing protein [Candidatus Kerfeldbacteria bacterium]|nr:DUF192 domain-containing protein [Candidatus Kerfeldbacteria bacterium]
MAVYSRAAGAIIFIIGLVGCGSSTVSTTVQFSNPSNTQVTVTIADTATERSQGLAGTRQLAQDHGLLFVFPSKASHAFWMKGVSYPIDIIWLDDSTIVDVTAQVQPELAATPETAYQQYLPNQPVNQVLEVPAGFITEQGIMVGQQITIRTR